MSLRAAVTLEPGERWGGPGLLPADAPLVGTDRDLAQATTEGGPNQIVGLIGGDLCRTLGGTGDVATRLGTETHLSPVDAVTARLDDGPPQLFAAHLVARGWLWHGAALVVMNADVLGEWRPAPRAHPGDGLLDAVHGSLSLRQRVLARRRLRTGDHLPHPDISVERAATFSWESSRPRRVELDGVFVGRHRKVSVQVIENFWSVAV